MKSKINIKHMKEHISHLKITVKSKTLKIYIKIKLNAHLKDEAQCLLFKLFKISKLFKLFKPRNLKICSKIKNQKLVKTKPSRN